MKSNNLNQRGQRRVAGLDLVRCCAIFNVIAVHFFTLNTSLYQVNFEGISLFVQASFAPFFFSGVPLFLMLTGYLNSKKTISRQYYRGIWRVLFAYLFFAVVTLLFRKYYLRQDFGFLQALHMITKFKAVPYAWYIEMWIGLFLITPFLNILYDNIAERRHKLLLLATFFVMVALPAGLNIYGFHLVPGYWQNCHPILFFFIGRYIKEYQPTIKSGYLIAAITVSCLITPVFNAICIDNQPIIRITGTVYGQPHAIFGTIIAVAFFLLVYKVDFRSEAVKGGLARVSVLSLDMYLCCYIFDAFYYPIFKERFFVSQSQFGIWFFVLVPLVFVSSFALAQMKDWLFKLTRLEKLLT